MPLFGDRLKYVTSRLWNTADDGAFYPELEDTELAVPDLTARRDTGLAFSGGGTRSAAATLGQLRGLDMLGLLERAGFISCVSGGSWACTPFAYLPRGIPDETFLGQHIPPAQLTVTALKTTDRNSLAHRIANAVLIDNFLKQAARLAGDETYSRAVGEVFLEPFGIQSLKRFFTFSQETITAIRERNPRMRPDDFHTVRPGRPFLIIGSTLLRAQNRDPLPTRVHFETTPLYAGARVRHEQAGSGNRDLGGGYIEPFAMDSDAPDDAPGDAALATVRLGAYRHRYTLQDAIGASGAAPAETLAELDLDWLGFPEFKHWPPGAPAGVTAREYTFGDGGLLENLGVMPLLMRKVARIIVFVNTRDRLRGPGKGQINDSIPPLFGQTPDFMVNHVFPADRYQGLVDKLLAVQEGGGPVMAREVYPVLENPHYGVAGGWEAEVLWVYNERVPQWEAELPSRLRKLIGVGSLGNFPHYRTFFQNPPALIDLSAKQTNLLANLACWTVLHHREIFREMLDPGY